MKSFLHYIQHDQMDCGPTCLRMGPPTTAIGWTSGVKKVALSKPKNVVPVFCLSLGLHYLCPPEGGERNND